MVSAHLYITSPCDKVQSNAINYPLYLHDQSATNHQLEEYLDLKCIRHAQKILAELVSSVTLSINCRKTTGID